jgi:hypothetical protein
MDQNDKFLAKNFLLKFFIKNFDLESAPFLEVCLFLVNQKGDLKKSE